MITGEQDIQMFGLLSLRKRLEIEIKLPRFADRMTMVGCRNLGYTGRTRKNALIWINGLLEDFDKRKEDHVRKNKGHV